MKSTIFEWTHVVPTDDDGWAGVAQSFPLRAISQYSDMNVRRAALKCSQAARSFLRSPKAGEFRLHDGHLEYRIEVEYLGPDHDLFQAAVAELRGHIASLIRTPPVALPADEKENKVHETAEKVTQPADEKEKKKQETLEREINGALDKITRQTGRPKVKVAILGQPMEFTAPQRAPQGCVADNSQEKPLKATGKCLGFLDESRTTILRIEKSTKKFKVATGREDLRTMLLESQLMRHLIEIEYIPARDAKSLAGEIREIRRPGTP
ncbi:MAG: hypothetical protein M3O62_16605 [Pseudomonadota bacterium]|nr:hypothetical protein [Pseudomonadota bacterium]